MKQDIERQNEVNNIAELPSADHGAASVLGETNEYVSSSNMEHAPVEGRALPRGCTVVYHTLGGTLTRWSRFVTAYHSRCFDLR
jgi:hypothetical protein